MFTIERFVADCEAAVKSGDGRDAVRSVLRAAISKPAEIILALGAPRRAGDQVLHRSPRLTILHIIWPPSFTTVPHNHLLWAEIGVYSGREDNLFWRRSRTNGKWPIEVTGAASVCAGSCHSLDADVIHSITNPIDKVTAGLHVYGGDLRTGAPRSMWDGESLMECPLDYARDDRAVDAYNAGLG